MQNARLEFVQALCLGLSFELGLHKNEGGEERGLEREKRERERGRQRRE